jgi:hypothetical protein
MSIQQDMWIIALCNSGKMDAISICLCDLLMNHLEGLAFITWGCSRSYTSIHDRVFSDYYGI